MSQGYEDYMEPVLARLDCLRRRGAGALAPLRAAFRQAGELLHSYFPEHLDRAFRWGGSRLLLNLRAGVYRGLLCY